MLSDTEKRRKYEQFGNYWNQNGGISNGGFDNDFGRYGNFDDFINDLLGRFGGIGGSNNFSRNSNFGNPSNSRKSINNFILCLSFHYILFQIIILK